MIKCTYCSKFPFLRHIQICILSFSWILFDGLVVGVCVCKDVSVQPASQHICIIFYHLNLLIYVNVSKILLWSNEESTYVSSRTVSCPLDKKNYQPKACPSCKRRLTIWWLYLQPDYINIFQRFDRPRKRLEAAFWIY